MNRRLTNAEINHLHRLVGYIRCDIWQSPEEMLETLRDIAPALKSTGGVDPEGELRLREQYEKAAAIPKYIRAAVKALSKTLREIDEKGEAIEGEQGEGQFQIPRQMPELP